MKTFSELGLPSKLLKKIEHMGFQEPTEIQALAIPHILQRKDVLAESATGSGKTLAFGCGVMEIVKPQRGVQAIILTPTRELAEQVKVALRKLAYQKKLKVLAVYGGVSIFRQTQHLPDADIVVATPGRLLDHMERGSISLEQVRMIVLDEADCMLDMGFIGDIEKIIKKCPQGVQTLLFSATLPSKIKQLAKNYMRKPVQVTAPVHVDPKKLKQKGYIIHKDLKPQLLLELLEKETSQLAMVFCNTRKTVDLVTSYLRMNKINALAIHGGFSQDRRNKSLKKFHSGEKQILVCTDVAARGLHIHDVTHIYNYDIPKNTQNYVHRIGRTARAGKSGYIINLISKMDKSNLNAVLKQYPTLEIEIEKITSRLEKDQRFNNIKPERYRTKKKKKPVTKDDSGKKERSAGKDNFEKKERSAGKDNFGRKERSSGKDNFGRKERSSGKDNFGRKDRSAGKDTYKKKKSNINKRARK